MRYIVNLIVWLTLWMSICLNVFMIANFKSSCENIDSRWKADILYKMWHRNLDWDGDGIACENLPYNQE